VSERRACRVVGQHRSVPRHDAIEDQAERRLVSEMRHHARRNPRFGYRRVGILLREEGWRVNDKRLHRLWRREDLRVSKRRRNRRRVGSSENGIVRRRAEHPNHVWTYDFMYDRTADGRRIKILAVVDEFTRECLALEFERRSGALDVVEVLRELFMVRGAPTFVRSDNGGEFAADAMRAWLDRVGSSTLFIAPGAPWENAYIESFNGKLRDELLDNELFDTLAEAKHLGERWRLHYNHRRPHSSIGYMTPAAFAAAQGVVTSVTSGASDAFRTSPPRTSGAGITASTRSGGEASSPRRDQGGRGPSPLEPPPPQKGIGQADDARRLAGSWSCTMNQLS